MTARRLGESFIYLGRGASAVPQPGFSGPDWYEAYGERHAADGAEGRLVSQHAFRESWPAWEMHPHGAEVVICIAGGMVLVQEHADGTREKIPLIAGEYAINPPGTWHIGDLPGPTGEEHAEAIFITPGEGTQHRPR